MFCFECARSVPIDAPRDDIGLLKQTPPKPIPTTIWKRARSQEMHVSASNQSLSAPSCNCAFALTSLTKYTMKLLSMSVPEMLRSLENQNTENIFCSQHCHSVILPNLDEVEQVIRNRNAALRSAEPCISDAANDDDASGDGNDNSNDDDDADEDDDDDEVDYGEQTVEVGYERPYADGAIVRRKYCDDDKRQ